MKNVQGIKDLQRLYNTHDLTTSVELEQVVIFQTPEKICSMTTREKICSMTPLTSFYEIQYSSFVSGYTLYKDCIPVIKMIKTSFHPTHIYELLCTRTGGRHHYLMSPRPVPQSAYEDQDMNAVPPVLNDSSGARR